MTKVLYLNILLPFSFANFSTSQRMELSLPVIHLSSLTDSLPKFPNKCYIIFLSHKDSLGILEKMVKDLSNKPQLVIYLNIHDHTPLAMLGAHHEPWVSYVPGSSTIAMTCSGDSIVRKGLLHDLAGTIGHVKESCSLKNREIRIAHNINPPFFTVNNGVIDQTTLEGSYLTTFLDRFSLHPSFVFAQQVWGVQNKSSGIWNGIIGLVRKTF